MEDSSRRAADRWLPLGTSLIVTSLFFVDVCGWIFACGCRSLWAGADAFCNVHAASPPHCPFCLRGIPGYVVIFGLVSLPQWAASVWLPWSRSVRTIVCLAIFPLAMIVVGVGFGWWDGYWR